MNVSIWELNKVPNQNAIMIQRFRFVSQSWQNFRSRSRDPDRSAHCSNFWNWAAGSNLNPRIQNQVDEVTEEAKCAETVFLFPVHLSDAKDATGNVEFHKRPL